MRPPTLVEAFCSGAKGVTLWCIPCNRTVRLTMDQATVTYGPEATFPDIARRSRCKVCGSKSIDARPHYPHPQPNQTIDPWMRKR